MASKSSIRIFVLYAIVVALVLWNGMQITGMATGIGREKEEWVCAEYVCDKIASAEEWLKQNCYAVKDDAKQGDEEVVCGVIINGSKMDVPLNKVRFENDQQCLEARCVREVKSRAVNYKVEIQKM